MVRDTHVDNIISKNQGENIKSEQQQVNEVRYIPVNDESILFSRVTTDNLIVRILWFMY